jgi:hypothetical protein
MLSLATPRRDRPVGLSASARVWICRRSVWRRLWSSTAASLLDGSAVSLLYRDGLLVRGATRGDGGTGETSASTQSVTCRQSRRRRVASRGGAWQSLCPSAFAALNARQLGRAARPSLTRATLLARVSWTKKRNHRWSPLSSAVTALARCR